MTRLKPARRLLEKHSGREVPLKRTLTRFESAILSLTVVFAGCIAAGGESAARLTPSERLATFAKLYGYVRFFHPSDEAARIDWDRFAVHGARRVATIETRAELRTELEALFRPLAPTLRVYAKGQEPGPPPPGDVPERPVLVAWQHRGVGLGREPYRSVRVNRLADPYALANSASRYVFDEDYADHRYRLSAQVRARVTDGDNGGRLFLKVLNGRFEEYIRDDLRDRLVTTPSWTRAELRGTFDQGTRFITYGVGLAGLGEACFDELRFEVATEGGEWRDLEVENAGFETAVAGLPSHWDFEGYGYRFVVSEEEPYRGERSGCIRSLQGLMFGSLFERLPAAGEEIDKPLGSGLRVRLPIALRLAEEPSAEAAPELTGLLEELETIDLEELDAADPAVRVAAVTIAWNVFQHFYPYFDVVPVEWDGVLTEVLAHALGDSGTSDFRATLNWLVAQLHDGHAGVFHPDLSAFFVDIELGWIEDRLVVVDPRRIEALEPGDVVEQIDGTDASAMVEAAAAKRSGSLQWRRHLAVAQLAPGEEGSPVTLAIRRGDLRFTHEIPRSTRFGARKEIDVPAVRRLDDEIWLVDLTRAAMQEIDDRVEELASAPGVVFDLRGYPNSNHDVLGHLTDRPLRSARWQVPQIIYPDREKLVGYDTSGRWTLHPRKPRFQGRAVFLTDARAISYAESVMGIVEHYHLGEIVGSPTAGTNGNVNGLALPGGFHLSWTGMKVVKHDDSQHHLVGILPTLPVSPTIAGVRAGRDEVLETAVRLLAAD